MGTSTKRFGSAWRILGALRRGWGMGVGERYRRIRYILQMRVFFERSILSRLTEVNDITDRFTKNNF